MGQPQSEYDPELHRARILGCSRVLDHPGELEELLRYWVQVELGGYGCGDNHQVSGRELSRIWIPC